MNAVLGLGSSVPEAHRVLDTFMARLDNDPRVQCMGQSPRRATAPWGGATHHRFVNAAVAVSTRLTPQGLLAWCRTEEHRAGRLRVLANASRTLDVDVLHIEGVRLQGPALTVPHPGLFVRAFAWGPLTGACADAGWSLPPRPISAALS